MGALGITLIEAEVLCIYCGHNGLQAPGITAVCNIVDLLQNSWVRNLLLG
jgi:hypothetical protein